MCAPNNQKLFHLKLLLLRIKGVCSYDDLKTFESKRYKKFVDTAITMGIIHNEKEIFETFVESRITMMSSKLRTYFIYFNIRAN